MAQVKVRHLVEQVGKGGRGRWYWQPPAALRKAGWRLQRLRDDQGRPVTTRAAAVAAAEKINAQLDAWRAGSPLAEGPAPIPRVQAGSVADVIRRYKASPRFKKLAPKTQADYGAHLRAIEAEFGDGPARAITRKVVQLYYEDLRAPESDAPDAPPRAPAAANARIRVLRLLLKYAWDHGEVDSNAAEKPGLIGTEPRIRIWSAEELAALVAAADAQGLPSIGDAVLVAHEIGQRQGDILRLPRIRYQEGRFKLRQRKRGALVDVPATQVLKDRLAAAAERLKQSEAPTLIVCETTKAAWKEDHFRHVFAQVRALAVAGDDEKKLRPCPSLADAWFMDLRDTAVTHLGEAGCTIPEICSVTGHSERSAFSILKHYLALNSEIASAAIRKLVEHREQKAAKEAT